MRQEDIAGMILDAEYAQSRGALEGLMAENKRLAKVRLKAWTVRETTKQPKKSRRCYLVVSAVGIVEATNSRVKQQRQIEIETNFVLLRAIGWSGEDVRIFKPSMRIRKTSNRCRLDVVRRPKESVKMQRSKPRRFKDSAVARRL
jgi:hypothetical protein